MRRLVGGGRGFAEECGFRVTNNPANLFQLLYLSVLLRNRADYRGAVRTAQAVRDRGADSPVRVARSGHEERLGVPGESDDVVRVLVDLARALVERYGGDLRRLRTRAGSDPARERQLLRELPGVDDEAVDLFFRDVQAVWGEVAPFADRRALAAARRLGLGRSAADLSSLASGGGSEKVAWLVGALARIDLENRYHEVRRIPS